MWLASDENGVFVRSVTNAGGYLIWRDQALTDTDCFAAAASASV